MQHIRKRSRAMPFRVPVVSLIVAACLFAFANTARAQDAPPLWIQSVTVDAAAGTATITGTGFSETCAVTLDGHAMTVLSGGTATRLVVVAPAALLATPGTYRLPVTDAGRQAGDAFEITLAGIPAVTTGAGTHADPGDGTSLSPGLRAASFAASDDRVGPRLIENGGSPWTTAVGNFAGGGSTGPENTAVGYSALLSNTTGAYNVAVGSKAMLYGNGSRNVGVGAAALYNSTGTFNTAVGIGAGFEAAGSWNI